MAEVTFTPGQRVTWYHVLNGAFRAVTQTRNRRTVWWIPTQPYRGAHFAPFPEKLVEPCILAGSRPGDLVLDPFCGSGTVGAVSRRFGRRFVGLDLQPNYLELAQGRIGRAPVGLGL